MKRYLRIVTCFAVVLVLFSGAPVNAVTLKIAPLRYQTTLKKDEKQKGFVDIANPMARTITVAFEVKAFRQVDDQGGIEFYDDKTVQSGILLDLNSVELKTREVLRLYFVIDGSKLPSGEVYAAILARTVQSNTTGSAQAVRVGTILEIINGSPSVHHSTISDMEAPFLQISDHIEAHFTVKNDDSGSGVTGYRPNIMFGIKPYSSTQTEGPLVFAGRSRTVDYSESGNYVGFVWLEASVDGSSRGTLAFVVTGYWRWLAPMILVAGTLLVLAIRLTRRKKH